jgi:hypothetical protein
LVVNASRYSVVRDVSKVQELGDKLGNREGRSATACVLRKRDAAKDHISPLLGSVLSFVCVLICFGSSYGSDHASLDSFTRRGNGYGAKLDDYVQGLQEWTKHLFQNFPGFCDSLDEEVSSKENDGVVAATITGFE